MRWTLFDALRELHEELGHPVLEEEIAAHIGTPVESVGLGTLELVRLAYRRVVPGTNRKGWVPAEPKPRIAEALAAFAALSPGDHSYELPAWQQRRKQNSRRANLKDHQERVVQPFVVDRAYQQRISKLIEDAIDRLGIGTVEALTIDLVPLLMGAVYGSRMERSLVPEALWSSKHPEAVKARKSAKNREGDVRRVLEWAQAQGFIDLRVLYPRNGTILLPRPWAFWVSLDGPNVIVDGGLALAKRAIWLGYGSPERLAADGFPTFEAIVLGDPGYSSDVSAKQAVCRFRSAWNARAEQCGLPLWSPNNPVPYAKDDSGGLTVTWWSAHSFFYGRPSLMDEERMERQRGQARDLRDWWTLANPATRPAKDGGPLPKRPAHAPGQRRRPGARDEQEATALAPLWAVTRFQRFAMDEDFEGERIAVKTMEQLAWSNLFSDVGRVERFVRKSFEDAVLSHGGGRDEKGAIHGGTLVKTPSVDAARYVALLASVYFPAYVTKERDELNRERIRLPHTPVGDSRRLEIVARQEELLEEELIWADVVEAARREYNRCEEKFGGFVMVKDKEELAKRLFHRDIARIADYYRVERERLGDQILARSKQELAELALLRERPCSKCGRRACDEHLPIPKLTPYGRLHDLLTREYCQLITAEALLRLPSLVPWRPSTFYRAQIGEHIDPQTLALAVVGLDGKVARNSDGTIKCQSALLGDIKPPAFMPPDSGLMTVEVVRLMLDEAQPWLAAHPTNRGLKHRTSRSKYLLFLNYDGAPCDRSISPMIRRILSKGERGVNANLSDGEEPIHLPAGWGARTSYIFRWLWGHRAVENGASFHEVALAMGNTETTVRLAYHAVHPNHGMNMVADATHAYAARRVEPTDEERVASSTGLSVRLPLVAQLQELKREHESELARLGVGKAEMEELWQQQLPELIGLLKGRG